MASESQGADALSRKLGAMKFDTTRIEFDHTALLDACPFLRGKDTQ